MSPAQIAALIAAFDVATRLATDLYAAHQRGEMTAEAYAQAVAALVERSRNHVLAAHAAWDGPKKDS